MTLLIDTGVVPAEERAQFWAVSSGDPYHPLRIRAAAGAAFEARMWARRAGDVGLFRIQTAANTMTRTTADIGAGDPECLHLSVVLKGRLYGAQHDREAALLAGDLTTYDTSAPALFRTPDVFDTLVLQLPKQLLGRRADRLSRLTAVRVTAQTGLPRLTARLICDLADAGDSGNGGDSTRFDEVLDLVDRLCAAPDARSPQAGSRTELVRQARAYIAAHLADPALDPEQVARACFVSTRYLHRLFEADGLTVCDWIRQQRLEGCRRDLMAAACADEPIAVIARRWGLPRAAHFSRLFRAAYGCSPRDFRRGVLVAGAADGA